MEIYLSNCLVHVGQGNLICLGIIWCLKKPWIPLLEIEKDTFPKVIYDWLFYSRKFVYPFVPSIQWIWDVLGYA